MNINLNWMAGVVEWLNWAQVSDWYLNREQLYRCNCNASMVMFITIAWNSSKLQFSCKTIKQESIPKSVFGLDDSLRMLEWNIETRSNWHNTCSWETVCTGCCWDSNSPLLVDCSPGSHPWSCSCIGQCSTRSDCKTTHSPVETKRNQRRTKRLSIVCVSWCLVFEFNMHTDPIQWK